VLVKSATTVYLEKHANIGLTVICCARICLHAVYHQPIT